MIRKIGHSKATFKGTIFAKGRGGKLWGWASNGRGKAIVDLGEAVWSDANGPIPSGSRLVYLDGDFENCALENLSITGAKPKAEKAKPAKKAKAKKASK